RSLSGLLTLYLISGPLVLLVENTSGGDPLERVLQALPLGRATVRLHVWMPVAVLALLIEGLLLPPLILVVASGGVPFAEAVGLAFDTAAVSVATMLVILALVKTVLRGSGWSSAHYPVGLLLFMAVAVIVTYSVVDQTRPSPWYDVLVVPGLLRRVLHGQGTTAGLVLLQFGAAVVVCLLSFVQMVRLRQSEPVSRVRPGWPIRPNASIIRGELVQVLRAPIIVSNLAGAVLVNLFMVAGLVSLAPHVGEALVTPAVGIAAFFAGLTPRMLRGLFERQLPPQLHAGVAMSDWLNRLSVCAVLVFAVGLAPMAGLGAAPNLLSHLDYSTASVSVLSALEAVLGLMWVLPLDAREPIQQMAGTVVFALASGAPTMVLTRIADHNGLLALLGCLLLLPAWWKLARSAERRRWRVSTTE
ncbi:MAG TPA: hypothetical protein VFP72_05810, partial [Kineosporiaceae bacterium]|nr:hypothetical protein [Kineosporiaceae bacterium]